jgi:hypothetical protein
VALEAAAEPIPHRPDRPSGVPTMDTRTLNDAERRRLISALRSNALENRAILMDRRTTRFIGASDEATDDEVITAIKSVPCHY